MKYTVIISLSMFLLLVSSCTTYYYSTIDAVSRYTDIKDPHGDFVFENDTVRVVYRFFGEQAPIHIMVTNKTGQPLYLDWKRSALIVDGTATSYQQGAQFSADVNTSSYHYGRFEDTSGQISGDVALPASIVFVPPYSKVERTPLLLAEFTFEKIPNKAYEKRQILLNTEDTETKTIRMINYDTNNTPFYFSSYLTIYREGADGKPRDPMIFDQDFYISRLVKAGSISPTSFPGTREQRGDVFYVRNVKGTAAGIIAGTIVVGAVGIAIGGGSTYYEY